MAGNSTFRMVAGYGHVCFLCAGVPLGSETKSEQKPKKVYTNEDLSELRSKKINQSAARPQDAKQSKPAIRGIDDYRDNRGHDRAYWQQKARPLRNRVDVLNAQISSLEKKRGSLNATSGVKVTRSGKLRANSADTRLQMDKRIDTLKREKEETLKALQDLDEEARKAGALPEWLR